MYNLLVSVYTETCAVTRSILVEDADYAISLQSQLNTLGYTTVLSKNYPVDSLELEAVVESVIEAGKPNRVSLYDDL